MNCCLISRIGYTTVATALQKTAQGMRIPPFLGY
jgi:hypothetical protein